MQLLDWSKVATLIKVALDAGGRRVTPTLYEWDVSNGCEQPVLRSFTGRPEADEGSRFVYIASGKRHTVTLEMWVACRTCARCMRRRRRMWTMRAAAEIYTNRDPSSASGLPVNDRITGCSHPFDTSHS